MLKTRGAYLVMTAARELREEGYDEGFAIIALGHALFAEERLEPAHGVPGTLWGSQRKQRLRGKVEEATERARATERHTYTEAARIQPLPAIHHVLHRNIPSVCCVVLRLGHVRSCPPPTRRLPFCLCVPTHDTGIVILGDDELQYRPTLAALSKNKWWEFKTWDSGVANLGQLARIGGVLWDEIGAGVHFGGCAGGSTLAHHMHRAWPGCLVFTAGGGCGHSIRDYKWALQHGELHRIWGPSMPAVATNSATSRVVGSARDRCRST